MIELHSFEEQDFDQLIAAIPDTRFLLQWAGPKYHFPLTGLQLNDTLAEATGEQPSHQVFKVVKSEAKETVGHVQLLNIDRSVARCVLGRILVFKNYRGKGLGKEIVRLAIIEAFDVLGLHEVILFVFDFNIPAIRTYKSLGFSECQFQKGARRFQSETWNLIKMDLTREKWLQRAKCW